MTSHSDVASAAVPRPDAATLTRAADAFALLGDPNRLRLLISLLDGEQCVGGLAEANGQSESAVSHALRLLRAHGIVAARRSGRHVFYRLEDAHVRNLIEIALAHSDEADHLDHSHHGPIEGDN
ncbi:ArsR family transcriptional regulator [Enemella evansiae]|uniref:ArsR/SmtB family transcription factor n=1 Tax=Enemella evansiae TaxID=2016499 RepID=UPI000B96BD7F|nr:metalloregulator ArsR/SmtB family transcription factor [Enemella evansiae]OYN99472.1 ArsR family transcriptional regulator [Enemella evansiae]